MQNLQEFKTIELVIARYQEDIGWSNDIKSSVKKTVYNKHSGENLLPNVGREGHTYLHHIVKNYDVLADWTFFSQGKISDHVSNFAAVVNEFPVLGSSVLPKLRVENQAYYLNSLNQHYHHKEGNPRHCIDVWKQLFIEPAPGSYEFCVGAIFVIHKDCIRNRSLEFYKKCLDLITSREQGPWEFERLFYYIFNPEIKSAI